MSEGFVGEIRLFPYSRIPQGWVRADGSVLMINRYGALAALLRTTYGGDGKTTFALPDLRGRVPLGYAADYHMGAAGGQESVSLTAGQLPAHTHALNACLEVGTTGNATDAHIAAISTDDLSPPNQRFLFGTYPAASDLTHLNEESIDAYGSPSPAPHNNMQPFSVIEFCICTTGYFPTHP